ncbi:MAG: hypothetical protein Ct9H300mP28_04200 [Pseudomonadota bacterium]|nr:MAG: hypothetical protein Ct9H300mP28_04200 [Pseudomonadota bacterium]
MYKKLYLFIGLFIFLNSLISFSKSEDSSTSSSSTSIFKAVGYSGTILSSPDGFTWTSSTWDSQNYGTSKNLSGINLGNSTFVAVGWYSTIISSSDGNLGQKGKFGENLGILVESLWKQYLCGGGLERNHLHLIGWNHMDFKDFWNDKIPQWSRLREGNPFVVVGSLVSLGNATILTSSDGTTWTSRTSGTADWLSGITYGNTTYVAWVILEEFKPSPDGITWTEQISGTSKNLENVIFANGPFLGFLGNSEN